MEKSGTSALMYGTLFLPLIPFTVGAQYWHIWLYLKSIGSHQEGIMFNLDFEEREKEQGLTEKEPERSSVSKGSSLTKGMGTLKRARCGG
jgi:hypothetical protein